jgi:hypothetical protein
VRAKKAGGYSGELAQPLPELRFGELFGDHPDEQVARLVAKRLMLLLQHYGIDENSPNPWLILSLRLAQDHVPGFLRKAWNSKKAGAPAKWKGARAMELHADVWQLVQQGNSEAMACRVLSREKYKPAGARSLLRRFKEVQRQHRNSGWSDEAVVDWDKLSRDPQAIPQLISAVQESKVENSA